MEGSATVWGEEKLSEAGGGTSSRPALAEGADGAAVVEGSGGVEVVAEGEGVVWKAEERSGECNDGRAAARLPSVWDDVG